MTLSEQMQHTPWLIFGVLDLCLATAYLALWRAAPDYRAFRTLGMFSAIVGAQQLWEYLGGTKSAWIFFAIAATVLIQAAAEAMRIPNYRWTWLFWPIYLFAFIAGWFPGTASVREWPIVVSELPLAILIFQGFRRGDIRDRMIAAAFSVQFLMRATLSPSIQHLTGIRRAIVIGEWQWPLISIVGTSMGAATLAIFVLDLIRDRREKQRMALELEAARVVQQVLIPDQPPSTPGFSIQSAYKPFGEVGGDFFQILPLGAGGVLITVGDVSGKGMQAAMMVSMLVGTLSALVESTTSPAQILAGLNRLTLGRSHGGFTTCQVLRADADGTLTIANAGHLPPYYNGREMELESGLPLGILSDTTYAESTIQLRCGDQVTFLSDGVVEAQNTTRELFGFERTRDISGKSAKEIAEAAQCWGQNDDITVVTARRQEVQRVGSEVEA